MLLRRMDGHPEEFADVRDPYSDERGKWAQIINELMHRMEIIDRDNGVESDPSAVYPIRQIKPLAYLSDEEVIRLYTKLMQVQRDQFEKRVMKALLTGPPLGVLPEEEYVQDTASLMTAPYGKYP